MDYYLSNNIHYQPMGFFIDNMSDSNVFYRHNDYGEVIYDPDLDPYQSTDGSWVVSDRVCGTLDALAVKQSFAKNVLSEGDLLFVLSKKDIEQDSNAEETDENSIFV